MPNGTRLLEVVDLLYGATLDQTLWQPALDAASDLLGAVGTNLEVIDKRTGWPVHFMGSSRLPGEAAAAYVAHYASLCPRTPRCLVEPAGYICCDDDVLSEDEISRDEFYADFLNPIDLQYFVSGNLLNNDRYFSVVAAQRASRHGHVERREIELMHALVPHFARAIAISARLSSLASYDGGPAYLVHASQVGILFLDRSGKVFAANPAAARIISENSADILWLNGTLAFRLPRLQQRFASFARKALDPEGDTEHGVLVVRRDGRLPLRVTVARLPRLSALADLTEGAAAAIWLWDGACAYTPPAGTLREDFGLTPAECRLAVALMQGRSLAEYAERTGIAMPTARTHLARIFHKTGTRNQQDLMRLLAHLSAPE